MVIFVIDRMKHSFNLGVVKTLLEINFLALELEQTESSVE
jgi:hypothetical protein